jgi:predicted negative regulator of RcsB-dependent stress response
MSKLDLYEQEQISKIQYFLKDYGKYILTVMSIIIIGYVASFLWADKQKENSLKACDLYSQLLIKIDNHQIKEATDILNKLNISYPKEGYTAFANLTMTKQYFIQKDYFNATKYINNLINNAQDKSMVAIAKLRLADIYIEQNKLDEALKIALNKPSSDFDVLYYQKQGDIYLLKKDLVKARDAYNAALQSSGGNQEIASLIKMKIDFAS